jgi:hypothetical protein
MRSGQSVTRLLVAGMLAAGAAGAALAIAGIDSPLRLPLVLLFLAGVPALATGSLFRDIDALAKVVIAGTSAIVINFGVAETMIVAGDWSIRTGVAGVAIVSAVIVAIRPAMDRMAPTSAVHPVEPAAPQPR